MCFLPHERGHTRMCCGYKAIWAHQQLQTRIAENTVQHFDSLHAANLAAFCPVRQHVRRQSVPGLPTFHAADNDDDPLVVNALSHEDCSHEYVLEDSAYVVASRAKRLRKRQRRHRGPFSTSPLALAFAELAYQSCTEFVGAASSACQLTPMEMKELQDMLDKHPKVFARDSSDLGNVAVDLGVQHEINTGTARPVAQRGYRLSHTETLFLKEQLESLLAKGIIRPSTSPWMSPVVLVKKKDGSLRLCIDYRALNDASIPDPYPLPWTDDILSRMQGCKYFSNMDVMSAFWNVPMKPEDVFKTGFTSPFGNFEWVRMPFGLENASSTFQRLMDNVLANCTNACAYIDDVFVFSNTWQEHLTHLDDTLSKLERAGLKLKISKCAFDCQSIKCLGHIIDEQGLHPDPDKISSISSIPAPIDVSGVRSFLGMTNYFRQFIKDYATICLPLIELTKKRSRFLWTPECQDAFDQLKRCLTEDPCLIMPDYSKPFILHTDWSKGAIGAVLSQISDDDLEHPVAYACRVLTSPERNYAPTEGECLALVWAVKKFRPYLHGKRFTVFTDHSALQRLNRARFTNSKLERWALCLQEHSFQILYKKGVENTVADCLSRPSGQPEHHAVADGMTALISACLVASANDSPNVPHETAKERKALESIPCTICGIPEGHDNMAFCDGCNRCFHLRCTLPPMSTAPSGPWFCAACDPMHRNLNELHDPHTPLRYSESDIYLKQDVIEYILSERDETLLPLEAATRRRMHELSFKFKPHPSIPGWLMVNKHAGSFHDRWLICPPLPYRWDIIRMFHDTLGHAGMNQTFHILHEHVYWPGC